MEGMAVATIVLSTAAMKIAIIARGRTSVRPGDVSADAWVDPAVRSSEGSFITLNDCTHEAQTAAREARIRSLYWECRLNADSVTKEKTPWPILSFTSSCTAMT